MLSADFRKVQIYKTFFSLCSQKWNLPLKISKSTTEHNQNLHIEYLEKDQHDMLPILTCLFLNFEIHTLM